MGGQTSFSRAAAAAKYASISAAKFGRAWARDSSSTTSTPRDPAVRLVPRPGTFPQQQRVCRPASNAPGEKHPQLIANLDRALNAEHRLNLAHSTPDFEPYSMFCAAESGAAIITTATSALPKASAGLRPLAGERAGVRRASQLTYLPLLWACQLHRAYDFLNAWLDFGRNMGAEK